ncbi:ISAs1 family transposase, partial [Bacteroides ovatus]|nr:ISAs1 family transposase [Bacteroides ovatus]
NFHEDNTRRRNISALNFSVLAKIALVTLRNNKREIPINRKRLIAGWDNEFLWELILHDL